MRNYFLYRKTNASTILKLIDQGQELREALINSVLLVIQGCATKTDGSKLLVLVEK